MSRVVTALSILLVYLVHSNAFRFAPCGPDETCVNPPVDVCFAVDMSGSVCAPSTGSHHCEFCHDACHEDGFTLDTCCSTFEYQISFTMDLADYVSTDIPESRFGLASFATEAQLDSPLVDKTTFRNNLHLDYRGGWTNTGDALQICYDLLKDSPNNKVVVLITDGRPTNGHPDREASYSSKHKEWATEKADLIKENDIKLIPILVSTKLSDQDYLESLATDPSYVTKVEDFHELKDDLDDVADLFMCEPEPPTDTCHEDPVDVCVAVDMSGSVCAPSTGSHHCEYCHDACHEDDLTLDVCCSTFENQMLFSVKLADYIASEVTSARFSLVSFGTEAVLESDLTDSDSFSQEVDALDYRGGWTDTGDALQLCYNSLKDSTNHKVVVLITDGTPTNGHPDFDAAYIQEHRDYATQQADIIKSDGIKLIPILVSTDLSDNDYLETLASNPSYVTKVEHFYGLEDELDDVVDMVKCDTPEEPTVPSGCSSEAIGVCVAVDMSGSVCTPASRDTGHHCLSCHNACHESQFSLETCCTTFNYQMTFANDLAMYVNYLNPTAQYSLVSFGTDAALETDLTTLNDFRYRVNTLAYRGGWTDTGTALELCHETLKDFDGQKAVILVTDGTPTNGHPDYDAGYIEEHKEFATSQADAIKADGIQIIPILVSTKLSDNEYLESLATNPSDVSIVEDFSDLEDNLDDIIKFVKCEATA